MRQLYVNDDGAGWRKIQIRNDLKLLRHTQWRIQNFMQFRGRALTNLFPLPKQKF